MQIDKTTYDDLSIFSQEAEFSIFQKFDFTQTFGGRQWLKYYFNNPFSDLKHIIETQRITAIFQRHASEWPATISNGTIMVMERFYETAIDNLPEGRDPINAFFYKLFHGPDYAITRYSLTHFADFFRGMRVLIGLYDNDDSPPLLRSYLQRAKSLLNQEIIISMAQNDSKLNLLNAAGGVLWSLYPEPFQEFSA